MVGWLIQDGPVQTDAKINDSYFSKSEKKRTRSAEDEFFADGKPKEKEAFPESKAADQREVDKVVLTAVKKTEYLAKYLQASWGLSKGEYPHQLAF
jgi:large subunit ribosomal protein L6e